jgi:hypothetical protein
MIRLGADEADEQSFLFQHYTYLEFGNLSCPGGCGNEYTRKPEDFFQLLVSFLIPLTKQG